MNNKVLKAKEILSKEDYTCVIINKEQIFTSKDRGVKPLLDWLNNKVDLRQASAADKVVGKAAAFLYVLLGVREVYAHVISQPAYEVLKNNGIEISFGEMVEAIKNRTNTGYCPMESAVWDVNSPEDAYDAIVTTRKKLAGI